MLLVLGGLVGIQIPNEHQTGETCARDFIFRLSYNSGNLLVYLHAVLTLALAYRLCTLSRPAKGKEP